MPELGCSLSCWTLSLLFCCLHHWGAVFPIKTTLSPPPAPSLTVTSRAGGTVLLSCTIPPHRPLGVKFELHTRRRLVDTVTPQSLTASAQFTVNLFTEPLCCLYWDENTISPFSIFVYPDDPVRSSAPPRGHPSLLSPPILSVTPPSGQVKRGQSMNFLCSLPPGSTATLPQAYVLLKTPRETPGVSEGSLVTPQTLWVSMTQFGSFDLGPVQGGEGGSYICLYQVTIPQKGMANSSLSKPVHVTVTDWLPVPTLSLYYQGDEWHLVCTGSPAFPGVQFSLYHQGSAQADSTQQVPITRHHAVFPLPASQPGPLALYQCQYTARLGSDWIQSDRSLSLEVPTNTGEPVVDWPLVLGCLSAVVLFTVSLAIMAIAMHRRAKSMAEERRKREQSMFWSKLHARDHVVDLTLKRSSFTSLDWANSGNTPESLSQPYHWQDMTSFHSPPT